MQTKRTQAIKALVYSAMLAAISVVMARLLSFSVAGGVRWSLDKFPLFLAGLFFGIAQIVNIGRLSSTVNNSMGMGDEFIVMAGCMLGGIKMGGGGGKMSNMVIGVLIIGVLNSGMNFLNMNQYWKYVVLGIALLAAVTLDTMQTRAAIKAAKKVSAPVIEEKKEEAK